MTYSSTPHSSGQDESREFVHVSDALIGEIARGVGASLSTKQIFTLVDLLLGVAYERERQAGVV